MGFRSGVGNFVHVSELSNLLTHRLAKTLAAKRPQQEAKMSDLRGERLQIMLSPEELSAVDDFRFNHRMPTRAAAVRELLKLGLASAGTVTRTGMKSSDYGVLGSSASGPGVGDGTDGAD